MHYELHVTLKQPEFCTLLETRIPTVYRKKKLEQQWYVRTDELLTPCGLPLVFDVELGIGQRIVVESRRHTLLRYHFSPPELAFVELLLPTDELLEVSIHRYNH